MNAPFDWGYGTAYGDQRPYPLTLSHQCRHNRTLQAFEKLVVNEEGLLLTENPRSQTTPSADQVNLNGVGVQLTLHITQVGAGKLVLELQQKIPGTTGYVVLAETKEIDKSGSWVLITGLGVSNNLNLDHLTLQGCGLPRTWRARVRHTGGTSPSWRYLLAYSYLSG